MKSDMPCVGDENSLDLSPEHLRRLDVDGQEWKEKHSIEVKSSLLTSIHSSLKKTSSGMCQMWGSTQRERGLEFSRRRKGHTFSSLHSLGLYNNNVSCLRTVSGKKLLANPVILKCKVWE